MVGDWNHPRLCWGLGQGSRSGLALGNLSRLSLLSILERDGERGASRSSHSVCGDRLICVIHKQQPPPCPCPLRLKGISRDGPTRPSPWGPAVSTWDEQPSVLFGKVSGCRAILRVRPARGAAAVHAVGEGPGPAAFRAGSVLRELPPRDAS